MKNYNEVISMPSIKENFKAPEAQIPEITPPYIPYDNVYHEPSHSGVHFLNAHIGKKMRIEFLLGNNLVEREGHLTSVSPNYILLHSCKCNEKLICNTDSIKFVTIIDED